MVITPPVLDAVALHGYLPEARHKVQLVEAGEGGNLLEDVSSVRDGVAVTSGLHV